MPRKLIALAFVCLAPLASACDTFIGEECVDDPDANHHAVNPATGACWEFVSSCDVPSGWEPCGQPPECDAEHPCPPDRVCTGGECVLVSDACVSDDDCPLTQHCQFPGAAPFQPPDAEEPAGVCVDNDPCAADPDCPMGQWCDLDPEGDCDPTLPDCGGGIAIAGICTRGPRPDGICSTTAQCEIGEICPAEYTGEPQSTCEPACTTSSDCIAGEHCSNEDGYCGVPRSLGPVDGVPICQGWCWQ